MIRPTLARFAVTVALPLPLAALLAGCAGSGTSSSEATHAITAADFAAPAPAADAGQSETIEVVPPIVVVSASEAREGINDVVVVRGEPILETKAGQSHANTPGLPVFTPGGQPSKTLLVDQMVGQINGRPIYASEFLADMDARLRQEAQKKSHRDWLRETSKTISDKVRDTMRDELLLSEFNTSLKPEQKPGIFYFINQVREDIKSGNLGSEQLAEKRLMEKEGLTVDQKAKAITDREFIKEQLRRTVLSRIQVSYRDIKRYYEQHPDEFQPPSAATFRIIQVSARDLSKIEAIKSALASGEAFADVAKRESTFRTSTGNLLTIDYTGPFAEATLFGQPKLNDAAKALSTGSRTEQVDSTGSAWWLMLEKIEQPPGKSFYEAQEQIEAKLRSQRFQDENARYFAGLLRRSSATDMNEMIVKLVQFADERYFGATRTRVPAPAAAPAPAPASSPAAPEKPAGEKPAAAPEPAPAVPPAFGE